MFIVAAGILPAVEPGILPGGMSVWFEKALPFRTVGPGGKTCLAGRQVPPSTAAKMAAASLAPRLSQKSLAANVVVFMERGTKAVRRAW